MSIAFYGYMNFFQPVMKIVSKTRRGDRVHKTYDAAQTPHQRLLKYDILSEKKHENLHRVYQSPDPATLIDRINYSLDKLWSLEDKIVHR